MRNHRILILGILPVVMERALSHAAELVSINELKRQQWESPAAMLSYKPTEAWQEKPSRRGGFAAARRQAKKNRRR
jgi:hypothetical protein